MEYLKTGKIEYAFLQKLLGSVEIRDKRVVIGPGIGEDAAAIDMGSHYLIVKSDPITFVQDRIGWYVVNVNANDIAAMGGTPKWFLVTILLPEGGTTPAVIEEIMNDLSCACSELGVSLIGGHTEVTHGLKGPILSGTMLGEVKREGLINNSDIKPGDALYLTKKVAIEATSIIARERRDEVVEQFGDSFYRRCLSFLQKPGISVVEDAQRALSAIKVTGMHDPTEGGILMGAYEMAQGSGIGLNLYADKIPVYPETQALCDYFKLSPFGLIASGALLIAAATENRKKLESHFEGAAGTGNAISFIGEFTGERNEVCLYRDEKCEIIHPSARDEITKLF
jgi:hydrogenase maturation factor